MATTKAKPDAGTELRIDPVNSRTIEVAIIGNTPLVQNRMSNKSLRELVMPSPRKTAAQRAATPKHDPMREFRDAAELMPEGFPTYLGVLSTAFKGTMMTAALDLPGATKARIGRLAFVEGERVPVWGIPAIGASVVRMADINKTPDVRFRPFVRRWASLIRITFVVPLLNERSILNLLAGGGLTAGVGDWRQEKGKGNFGQFRLTNHDDPEWLEIRQHGRAEQAAAMASPEPYDDLTRELLGWFEEETQRRGMAA